MASIREIDRGPSSQEHHGEIHNPADCEMRLIEGVEITNSDQIIRDFADEEKVLLCRLLSLREKLDSGQIDEKDFVNRAKTLRDEGVKFFDNQSLEEVFNYIKTRKEEPDTAGDIGRGMNNPLRSWDELKSDLYRYLNTNNLGGLNSDQVEVLRKRYEVERDFKDGKFETREEIENRRNGFREESEQFFEESVFVLAYDFVETNASRTE